jgi:hypothetical protein
VCLDAGKKASRHETATEIQSKKRQKGAEHSTKKKTSKQRRDFPLPVKPLRNFSGDATGIRMNSFTVPDQA